MSRPALAAVAALALGAVLSPRPAAGDAPPPPEEERPIDAVPIPTETSASPKPAEWVTAPRVR